MKKQIITALILICLSLCACSSVPVEELLAAPSLTVEQSAVQQAVEGFSDEPVSLKYPISGQQRAPIHFVDLDSDGEEEALVFYSIPTLGIYAHLAALQKDESGEWVVASDVEGAGTDVESFSVVEYENDSSTYVLVEWSSVNSSAGNIHVYGFQDGALKVGFEDKCVKLLSADLDSDGTLELCYISNRSSAPKYALSIVEYNGENLVEAGSISLNYWMLDCINLNAGILNDGMPALFVDEHIDRNQHTTEVFVLADGELLRLDENEDYTISSLAQRNESSLISRELYTDATWVPSGTAPYGEIADTKAWCYWYSFGTNGASFEAVSYYGETYEFLLSIPKSWLGFASVNENHADSRRVSILNKLSGNYLFEIQVLAVGEDPEPYVESGFKMLASSGIYRYYYRSFCAEEDEEFLIDNFLIL